MENAYLIISEEKDSNGDVRKVSHLHNLVYDETDNVFHVYSSRTNTVRYEGYGRDIGEACKEFESRLEDFKKHNIIYEYINLGTIKFPMESED